MTAGWFEVALAAGTLFYGAVILWLGVGIARSRRGACRNAATPSVSIVGAARNEAQNISSCLLALRRQVYAGSLQIVVVDDRSTDGTGALVECISEQWTTAEDVDAQLVVVSAPQSPRYACPKKSALAAGIEVSDGDLLLFTDADRNEITGEYVFALVEPYRGDQFLYDRNTMANTVKGSVVGHAKQLAGEGGFDAEIRRTQQTVPPNTGTPVYELWFSPGAIGAEALKQTVVFGLGVAVIDSDPDAPGKQGWSGLGPDSVVSETNPAETALITLVGDPEDDGDGGG